MSEKIKKKFSETKAGKLLAQIKNPALDLVGDLIPGASLVTNLIKSVTNDSNIDPSMKSEIIEDLNQQLEMIRLENQDRDSARRREVELQKGGGSNWLMYFAGVFALMLFAFIAYVIVYREVPDENSALFHQLIGLIEGTVLSIFTYYFGSSKSSADKTKHLADSTPFRN